MSKLEFTCAGSGALYAASISELTDLLERLEQYTEEVRGARREVINRSELNGTRNIGQKRNNGNGN